MNLNTKFKRITIDGIPEYNQAINQLSAAVEWLLGVRTINGRPVRESDQGPVVDLSQTNMTQAVGGGDAIDPDGNRAGWRKITLIDTVAGNFFDVWAWTGALVSNTRPVPWLTDPSGLPAGWVVCAQPTFWGTGTCPVGIGNFQQVQFTANGPPQSTNPYILTGQVPNPPIVVPTNPPAFYLIADDGANVHAGLPHQPILWIVTAGGSTANPPTVNYSWTISYDGTTVFSISGSQTAEDINLDVFVLINPADWIYDPGGLPGYAQGSKKWIWQYQGAISANTNPVITETFSYSASIGTAEILLWNATVLTK